MINLEKKAQQKKTKATETNEILMGSQDKKKKVLKGQGKKLQKQRLFFTKKT